MKTDRGNAELIMKMLYVYVCILRMCMRVCVRVSHLDSDGGGWGKGVSVGFA